MSSKKILILFFALSLSSATFGQKIWTLDDCINYALENNYTVRQNIISKQVNEIQLNTTKNNILPNVNGQVGQTFNFGRAEAADGLIVDQNQSSTSFGVGLSMPLFNGLSNYYNILSSECNLQASLHDLEQVKEDISLNITAYYLQVLLAKEILEVAKEQVKISEEQVERLKIEVENGKTSESELYNAKSLLATDIVNVTQANNSYKLAKVDLAQLMNYNDYDSFDVAIPEGDGSNLLNQSIDINPIINNAVTNRHDIKAANSRIEQTKYDIKVAKANYYPSLSLNTSYGTGYYYYYNENLQSLNDPFFDQLNTNSREMISLSLQIPIFNKMAIRNGVRQTQLQLQSKEIQLEETKNTLTKAIYQAYTNATAAKDKFFASHDAVEATKISFEYEQIKYEAGASTSFEYNQAKLKYENALSSEIQSKYEYILRTKILEYYAR